jgi:hypothetical protein
MNQTTEKIESKEKSLSELMVRILKEPFKPLSNSIAQLAKASFESEKKIESIQSAIESLTVETDDNATKLRKMLRKICDEDLPELTVVLQKHLDTQTQKVTSAFDQQSNELKTISTDWVALLTEATGHRNKIELALSELHAQHNSDFASSSASQTAAAAAMQTALSEILSNRELMAKHHADASNQLQQLTDVLVAHMANTQSKLRLLIAISSGIFSILLGTACYYFWNIVN